MEYKSPFDHLDIDIFYRTSAYASLYKACRQTVDERKAEDIMVSVIRESKSEELFVKDYYVKYIESEAKVKIASLFCLPDKTNMSIIINGT